MYGGTLKVSAFKPSEAHFLVSLNTGVITSLAHLPHNGHSDMAGVYASSSLVFLLGGMNGNDDYNASCIWYDYKEGRVWNTGPPLIKPRLNPGALCIGDSIYVIGGVWSMGASSNNIDDLYFNQASIETFSRSGAAG